MDGYQNTHSGVLRRGVNGNVLMPAGMYQDIAMQFNYLSESMYYVVLYITCTKCKCYNE